MKIYRVGGAVRDRLLGYPCTENDWVVVGATPQQMADLNYRPVGSDFPVFIHPDTSEEYALARTERKSGHGYGGFTFHTDPSVTLQQDLIRRDLTINAMAEKENGDIVDPYNGRQDLQQRILRHVSPAFSEDPLRVLRTARFAARYHHLGFTIAAETWQLMAELSASGELEHLTPERVWKETQRALAEQNPQIYLSTLQRCGALAVIMPEVAALYGVPQRADYHPEVDTGIHIELSLQQAAARNNSTLVRFAALTHDLGKGTTQTEMLPRHIGHERRGSALISNLCDRLKVPNSYRQLAMAVGEFHGQYHQATTLRPKTLLKLLRQTGSLKSVQRLQDFIDSCEADIRGRPGWEQHSSPAGPYLLEIHSALQQIKVDDLVQQGVAGADIGRQLEQRQLQAIAVIKERYSDRAK